MSARRPLLTLLAGLVVLVVAASAIRGAWANRAGTAGGSLELTEHEAPLAWLPSESSVTLIQLEWAVSSPRRDGARAPAWLDLTKLRELGFDCSVPLDAPHARAHYGALPSRPVFLVLTRADAGTATDGPGANHASPLQVMDAGMDPGALRRRYPNRQSHVVARGLVRLGYMDRNHQTGEPLAAPMLEGWVVDLLPSQVFVPLPFSRTLAPFRPTSPDDPHSNKARGARFAVTIAWGERYEPWVTGVRVLPR